MAQNLDDRRSGMHLRRGQAIHVQVALVANHHPALGVKHDEALRHVGEGGVEQNVLIAQILLMRLQLGRQLRNPRCDQLLKLVGARAGGVCHIRQIRARSKRMQGKKLCLEVMILTPYLWVILPAATVMTWARVTNSLNVVGSAPDIQI